MLPLDKGILLQNLNILLAYEQTAKCKFIIYYEYMDQEYAEQCLFV